MGNQIPEDAYGNGTEDEYWTSQGTEGFSFETNVTAVFACLNNIGPGLGLVGPMGNYSAFSDFSKLVLTANMLIGRLEIFPILALLMPTTWRRG